MWLAAAVIMTISVFSAYRIVHNETQHYLTINLCSILLRSVRNKAVCYSYSFSELIELISREDRMLDVDFIDAFLRLEKNHRDTPSNWKKAVSESRIKLNTWEKDVLIVLGRNLCSCSENEVEEFCNTALKDMDAFAEVSKEKRQNKAKTSAVFTVSAGIMLVLLII